MAPHIYHRRRAVLPGKRARLIRLAVAGEEGRGIQSHPAALVDRHNGGTERPTLSAAQIDAAGNGSGTH